MSATRAALAIVLEVAADANRDVIASRIASAWARRDGTPTVSLDHVDALPARAAAEVLVHGRIPAYELRAMPEEDRAVLFGAPGDVPDVDSDQYRGRGNFARIPVPGLHTVADVAGWCRR